MINCTTSNNYECNGTGIIFGCIVGILLVSTFITGCCEISSKCKNKSNNPENNNLPLYSSLKEIKPPKYS